MLQDPGRLFDDGSAVFGPGVQDLVELPLADDHVLLAAHPGIREKLLDVEQPAGLTVDGVLAVTGAEESPGDGDLGQATGQVTGAVVDGERDLGAPEGGTISRSGEDDVLHLRRTHGARTLGTKDPGHSVNDVRLTAPVGPDHHGHARFQLQGRRVGERLEALQGQ